MATLNTSVAPATAQTTNKQRWLYSIANLGNVIPYQAVGSILLFYYTDFKHLPVKWAAMAMTIYAIYNALNNPVMGYFSDRTRSRWGRRIPWLLFGTLPCVISFAFIWMAPYDGLKDPGKLLAYFYIVLFIWEGLGDNGFNRLLLPSARDVYGLQGTHRCFCAYEYRANSRLVDWSCFASCALHCPGLSINGDHFCHDRRCCYVYWYPRNV